jgi:hypothetical protein
VADLFELLAAQQRAGFPDLAGARVAAFLPVSDRLLNAIVARDLPPDAPVSEVTIEALPENRIAVRARLARMAMLPPFKVTLTIVHQPTLPHDPVLVLRMGAGGLLSIAGPALKFLDALPPGMRADGDRLLVDIRALLAARGLDWVLRYVLDLQVTTAAGVVFLTTNAEVETARSSAIDNRGIGE